MEIYLDHIALNACLRMVLETYHTNETFVEIPKIQIDHIIEKFNELIFEDDYEIPSKGGYF